ncbi:cytochrome P450 [Lindgomyces ingoldianus]|uniref:Cytochrome P450 n=1 Tax=Lindgomyces ingoldianus TaxID=673940 RepID=A0ACB6RCN9_9PLEO|nr:cytochrome P450 [Lindgomyces ingoldianus]KAF2476092.1 cytochrome P450 [Lindgomyces ingoldianus]
MAWVLVAAFAAAVYAVSLCIYRIFISPLSKIPGPKLAAVTGWYKTYFKLCHKFSGQYLFHIQALHKIYEHHLHRMRRTSQAHFVAKGRIQKLAPQIQTLADRMCRRLVEDFSGQDKPVILNNVFTSFVGDVTTQYSFNRDFKYLEDPNFLSPFTREIRSFLAMVYPCTQFPWLGRLLYTLPDSLVSSVQPATQGLQEFRASMSTLIHQAKEDVREGNCETDKTVMHGILDSNLPPLEKSNKVLIDQAAGLVAAGILPYLTACVEEAIRLACGQITRYPRISHLSIIYGDYIMPPGTQISMDTWHMHHNETLYPDSYAFVPERWIGDSRAPDGKPLKHYMVAFGKGTRNCLGMNLAQAAITIALASLVRRFEFELFETSYEMDVQVARDVVAPGTHPESLGVRVFVN